MICAYVRRMALSVHIETKRPISDILADLVSAIQSGVVAWENKFCPFCGEKKDIRVTSSPGGFPVFIRLHKCGYCGTNFKSHEIKSVEVTDQIAAPIAKPKRKSHIKRRGG